MLAEVAPWVVLGALLLALALLYGRAQRGRGTDQQARKEAEGNEAKREEVAEIQARRLPRPVVLERLRRLREQRKREPR